MNSTHRKDVQRIVLWFLGILSALWILCGPVFGGVGLGLSPISYSMNPEIWALRHEYPYNISMVLGGLTLVGISVAILARRARTVAVLGSAVILLSFPAFITLFFYVPLTIVILLIAAAIAVRDREATRVEIADGTAMIAILAFLASLPIYVLSF